MKAIVNQDIDFWKNPEDVDKKQRERIKKGEIIEVATKDINRLAPYVSFVEEEEKDNDTNTKEEDTKKDKKDKKKE